MADVKYILDANVFISAARHYYAFDLVPGFWEAVIEYSQNGQVLSIDRIKQELIRGQDALSEWVNNNFENAFESTDSEETINKFSEIMNWVNSQEQFTDEAKAVFADSADGWLIAHAIVNNCVIVTHETYQLDIKNKVKIPNICVAFDARYINTFEMLREIGFKLTLNHS